MHPGLPREGDLREATPSEFGQASSTDGDICLPYFHTHFGCSMCVGVCPFTRRDYHTIKKAWLKRGGR
jgi:hypothetical protein